MGRQAGRDPKSLGAVWAVLSLSPGDCQSGSWKLISQYQQTLVWHDDSMNTFPKLLMECCICQSVFLWRERVLSSQGWAGWGSTVRQECYTSQTGLVWDLKRTLQGFFPLIQFIAKIMWFVFFSPGLVFCIWFIPFFSSYVYDKTQDWIWNFPTNCTQQVAVWAQRSTAGQITSGVPKGSIHMIYTMSLFEVNVEMLVWCCQGVIWPRPW